MSVRKGGKCPWGFCCKFELIGQGVCLGVHTKEEQMHFEGKRAGIRREKEAACAYCVSGTCRFGERCRRGMGGDSDYELESSGADVTSGDEEAGAPARALRSTKRVQRQGKRGRSSFRKLWSRQAHHSCEVRLSGKGNYYAPLQADFMGVVIGDEEPDDEVGSGVGDGLIEEGQAAAAGEAATTPAGVEGEVNGNRILEDDCSWLQEARARVQSGELVRKGGG